MTEKLRSKEQPKLGRVAGRRDLRDKGIITSPCCLQLSWFHSCGLPKPPVAGERAQRKTNRWFDEYNHVLPCLTFSFSLLGNRWPLFAHERTESNNQGNEDMPRMHVA